VGVLLHKLLALGAKAATVMGPTGALAEDAGDEVLCDACGAAVPHAAENVATSRHPRSAVVTRLTCTDIPPLCRGSFR
jgi:hypothetical protein